jgi:hypothetical protein
MRHEPEGSRDLRWWLQPFSVFQTNLQEVDATMDVDAALDVIEDYGSDTWLLNTGGIVSFYPTDLPFQTRNRYLIDRPSGDLVGDAVDAAHARGIRVIARLDLSKVSRQIAEAHPEWLFTSSTGAAQVYNDLYSVCPSGDYYQRRSFDIVDEIIDRYPVDGFFFNWFNFNEVDYSRVFHGVCHCAACRSRFAAEFSGAQLPSGPESSSFPNWSVFAGSTTLDITRRLGDHLASRRPDAGLLLRKGASIAYQEASNALGGDFWPHATGDAVSAHRAAEPDRPVLVNCVSFVDMPYRMAGEQPERFAQYLVQAIARGGNPSTYIMGAPGRIPYANLELAREITRFHARNTALYARLRPAATTAVVRPGGLGMLPSPYADPLNEFRGVSLSLQQTHHPFDVLGAETLEQMSCDGTLQRYALIVMPDLGSLGAGPAGVLDTFVEHGGLLLLTGTSGVTQEGDVELAASPAIRRVDAPMTGAELWSTYVTMDAQPDIDNHRYAPSIVPVFGSYARYSWKAGVTRYGALLAQAPFGPPEKCYGHTPSDDPVVVTASHGDGVVAVVPWTIGRTYREFATTEVRTLFAETVERLSPSVVTTDLPEQVELVLGRDDDGYVMHLINLSGVRHRSFGPHLPVRGGTLRLPASWSRTSSAKALVAEHVLQTRPAAGGGVEIELPPLGLFEVVRSPDRPSTGSTKPPRRFDGSGEPTRA